jgi:hypothetical protein
MPTQASAKRAIKVGVFVCGVLTLVDVVLAALLKNSWWRDYDSSLQGVALELAVFYLIVGWRLQKNSRIFAFLACS